MLWVALVRAASAGCIAWSDDDEARLATSAVIVAGTVRDLDLVDGIVRQHVEVDQTWNAGSGVGRGPDAVGPDRRGGAKP